MRAIRFVRTGGPEVLELVEIDTPTPGPGQILIRHEAIGINFIETYQRTGLYPVKLPAIPGGEVAGLVEAVGEGVTRFNVGDRVATTNAGGSLYLTRPTLGDYVVTTEELDESAALVFGMVASGKINIEIGQTFSLDDARNAHEALESRATVGASLLLP